MNIKSILMIPLILVYGFGLTGCSSNQLMHDHSQHQSSSEAHAEHSHASSSSN